jgi:hypothetical protein
LTTIPKKIPEELPGFLVLVKFALKNGTFLTKKKSSDDVCHQMIY